MKTPPGLSLRVGAIIMGAAIFLYCAAGAIAIQMQADRDLSTPATVLAVGLAFFGILLGGGFIVFAFRRPRG